MRLRGKSKLVVAHAWDFGVRSERTCGVLLEVFEGANWNDCTTSVAMRIARNAVTGPWTDE
jgi:hypothetical protein